MEKMFTLIFVSGFVLSFCLAAAGLIAGTLHDEHVNGAKPGPDLRA